MSRLFFRGIYFQQQGAWAWLKLAFQNRRAINGVVKDIFTRWHGDQDPERRLDFDGSPESSLRETAEQSAGGD